MIQILTSQAESDHAYRRWTQALIAGSTPTRYGWTIEGSGVVFNNYGHGAPGVIADQVMLGADPQFRSGVVKIVQPKTATRDKGRLTVIGREAGGRLLLLREGWLKGNNLSRAIKEDFEALTGLVPVELTVSGALSKRVWFVVADLDEAPEAILAQTAAFTLACAYARSLAGGERPPRQADPGYTLGLDERGRLITVKRRGGVDEVCALQGFVSQALKAILGDQLTRPTRGNFAVDAIVKTASLLIEIKTGVAPHDIYEAVGQLRLYPSIVGLDAGLEPVLLVPDNPPLGLALAASLDKVSLKVYTYAVGTVGKKPKITFSKAFLERCFRAPIKASP